MKKLRHHLFLVFLYFVSSLLDLFNLYGLECSCNNCSTFSRYMWQKYPPSAKRNGRSLVSLGSERSAWACLPNVAMRNCLLSQDSRPASKRSNALSDSLTCVIKGKDRIGELQSLVPLTSLITGTTHVKRKHQNIDGGIFSEFTH